MSLDNIRAREQAATEGPWEVELGSVSGDGLDFTPTSVFTNGGIDPWGEANNDYVLSYNITDEDAEFIAHARTDIPKLIAALDAVEAVLDAADNRPYELGKLRHGFLLHTKDVRAAITEALQ